MPCLEIDQNRCRAWRYQRFSCWKRNNSLTFGTKTMFSRDQMMTLLWNSSNMALKTKQQPWNRGDGLALAIHHANEQTILLCSLTRSLLPLRHGRQEKILSRSSALKKLTQAKTIQSMPASQRRSHGKAVMAISRQSFHGKPPPSSEPPNSRARYGEREKLRRTRKGRQRYSQLGAG